MCWLRAEANESFDEADEGKENSRGLFARMGRYAAYGNEEEKMRGGKKGGVSVVSLTRKKPFQLGRWRRLLRCWWRVYGMVSGLRGGCWMRQSGRCSDGSGLDMMSSVVVKSHGKC